MNHEDELEQAVLAILFVAKHASVTCFTRLLEDLSIRHEHFDIIMKDERVIEQTSLVFQGLVAKERNGDVVQTFLPTPVRGEDNSNCIRIVRDKNGMIV